MNVQYRKRSNNSLRKTKSQLMGIISHKDLWCDAYFKICLFTDSIARILLKTQPQKLFFAGP